MDIRKVKKLIDLLESSGMAEIEIKEGEESVRIVKSGITPVAPVVPVPPTPVQTFSTAEAISTSPASPVEVAIENGNAISSPMVGTFYSKPAPDAKPFVSVGDTIAVGDIICIVEAMKIMNKIEADKAGVVTQICLNDGDVVEFGQDLIIVS